MESLRSVWTHRFPSFFASISYNKIFIAFFRVCVFILFETSLPYSVWRLFQYAAQHSFNVCSTMCTILHTPFPFFYLVVLYFFFSSFGFCFIQFNALSFILICVLLSTPHAHTHSRATVEVRSDPKEISNLKYIFITITQLPNFSVFSPFDVRFNCADARFVTRLLCVRILSVSVSSSICACSVYIFFLCEPRLSLRFHYETDYLVLLLFLFILFSQSRQSIDDWIVISFSWLSYWMQ